MTTVLEHRCTPAKWVVIEEYDLYWLGMQEIKGKLIVQKCEKCGLIRSEKYPIN
jgi:uncharacterized OB-fold protein